MQTLKDIIGIANQYGFPLPLILIVFLLYRFFISRVNRWNEREKYYYLLVSNLGIWKDSLSDRLDYYQERGSEYQDEHIQSPNFMKISEKGTLALKAIRQELNVARIFLSENSTSILEDTLSDHWYIREHKSSCTYEYLESCLKIAQRAYEAILEDAKKDLQKNRFSITFQKMLTTN